MLVSVHLCTLTQVEFKDKHKDQLEVFCNKWHSMGCTTPSLAILELDITHDANERVPYLRNLFQNYHNEFNCGGGGVLPALTCLNLFTIYHNAFQGWGPLAILVQMCSRLPIMLWTGPYPDETHLYLIKYREELWMFWMRLSTTKNVHP